MIGKTRGYNSGIKPIWFLPSRAWGLKLEHKTVAISALKMSAQNRRGIQQEFRLI